MRKARNPAEIRFWLAVKRKRLLGLDFDRQRIIGSYIVDFYCHQLGLVIEIDGMSHAGKQDYDAIRDDYLFALGLHVMHFSDEQVLRELPHVLQCIRTFGEECSA